MADYEIDLNSLQSRKSDLDGLKSKASNIYNEFASSTLANLGGEISSLSNKLKTPMERFNKGYNNSSEWLGNYISEFQSLESNLASFSGNTIDKPVLFSKKFTDIFRKVTIPMIQTQAQKTTDDSATSTGPVTLTGNTNKDKIFSYLHSQGFNNAAICGILSNIQHESNFNPNSLGDSGTSYGICQWHNSRWTRLKNYCSKNNLSYKSLEGQVSFLVYELKKYYPKVYNTIKNVPNTKKGAYDAAYSWTVHYEVPVNRYKQGDRRGKAASSTYWDAYGNIK